MRTDFPHSKTRLRLVDGIGISERPRELKFAARGGFSLIEMMIAIVILGLGLVMTATMFPVAWTRARTLTEYTTQRVITQSASALIGQSLRPAGTAFAPYHANGALTGKYFLSGGSMAGDLFYDPVLHADGHPGVRLPCDPNACYSHLAVVLPSDMRVHALHMENVLATGAVTGENPFQIERMVELCQVNENPMICRTDYPLADIPIRCHSPVSEGAEFCAQSFYSPQVGVGPRMYPPINPPPADVASPEFAVWLEKFNTRRYAWAVLHRLRRPVGPVNVPGPPLFLTEANSVPLAREAASAAGTTRTFDFYFVTLKRPSVMSRYAVQDPDSAPVLGSDAVEIAVPAAQEETEDVLLPVAWRVQVEFPVNVKSRNGAGFNPPDPPTGVPTEVQVPVSGVSGDSSPILIGMFPTGTRFIDEITGQIYRVTGRRLNAESTLAFLTLDREVLLEDLDNSVVFGGDGVVQRVDAVRTVWVFPPPISERNGATIAFDESTPVVGIDIVTLSLSPPG
jgi:prepilin-type N-terminal cleavage/methylation domain-containing protein